MPLLEKRPRALHLEYLESRQVLSYGSIPPALIRLPVASAITLDAQFSRAGGSAITRNEIDYFTFVAPRPGSYRINTLTPTSALDSVIAVYNTAGRRIAFNDDISTQNSDSQLVVNLSAGQRCFLGISNFVGTPRGVYFWRIQGPHDDGYEDNDTLATASNLGALADSTTLSNLALADGADCFRFTMNGPGTPSDYVSIGFTHAQGDLDLELFDSGGLRLRSSAGSGNEERISLAGLAAGSYVVRVYGYQGAKNGSYRLTLDPGNPSLGAGPYRTLHLNFDGANLTRSDLLRYAGNDWRSSLDLLDADQNGIQVRPLLASRTDRDAIIQRILQLVQEDLRPFGIDVRRTTGLAVEGVGATTVFLGPSTLSGDNYHVAAQIDIGNNNLTDVAFVGDEDWGSVERTALALAHVTLHEAGHTWGLRHVNSGTDPEAMGLRYSVSDSNQWVVNTTFMDRTYPPLSPDDILGPQNAFQEMMALFGSGPTTSTVTSSSLPTVNAPADQSLPCGCPLCTDRAASGTEILRKEVENR